MTPQQIEIHRKRFAVIFADTYSYVFSSEIVGIQVFKKTDGHKLVTTINCYSENSEEYFTAFKQSAFIGYLLCAENMEVELPTKASTVFGEPNEHYNDGIESCKVLLEYQGIKVISVKHEFDRNMECAMETKGFTVRSILV